MSGARSEQPTPRRLLEARRRGEVARSRELPAAAALVAGLLALCAWGPDAVAQLARLLRSALLAAPSPSVTPSALLAEAGGRLAIVSAPLLLAPALAAGAAALAASGLSISFEPLRPRLDRLDLAKGLRRLTSPEALAPLALGLLKGAVVLAILWRWLAEQGRSLAQLPRLGVPVLLRALPAASPAARLAAVALALGLFDLALAHRRHRKALRMTRDEVRRESKEDEGDPQHRAERRRLHRAALEAGPVAKATVVVVNPTHVAVALEHRRDRDAAPRLLAKATGDGAARIRSAARRAGVPIVRDVALARAVARLVDVGEEIPPDLFEAAATVLAHVYGSEGSRP